MTNFHTQRNFPKTKFIFGKTPEPKNIELKVGNNSKVELNDISIHNEKYFKEIIKEKDKEIGQLKKELSFLKKKYNSSQQQNILLSGNTILGKQSSFDLDSNSLSNNKNYLSIFKGYNTISSNISITPRVDSLFPSSSQKQSSNGLIANSNKKNSYDDSIKLINTKTQDINMKNYKSSFDDIKKRMKIVLDKYSKGIIQKK